MLKTLQNIVYENTSTKLCVVKFMTTVLEIIGYKLNFDNCDNCGMKFLGDIKIDIYTGTFRCANCSGGEIISRQEFVTLKIIQNTPLDKLKTIKVSTDCLNRIFDLCVLDLSNRLNCKFKSLKD